MRTAYMNLQTFNIARRFSVSQLKFAWLLRKHPKRFNRRHGAKFEICKIPTTREERQVHLSKILSSILTEKRRLHDLDYAEAHAKH